MPAWLDEVRTLVLFLGWFNALLSIVLSEHHLILLILLLFMHEIHQFHEVNCGLVVLLAGEALLLLLLAQWNAWLVFTNK